MTLITSVSQNLVSVPLAFVSHIPPAKSHYLAQSSFANPAKTCARRIRIRVARLPLVHIIHAEAGTASPRDSNSDGDGGNSERDGGDDGAYEIPQSEFDWNADWNKYQQDLAEGLAPAAPPGRAPPTPAEKAARTAAARVSTIKGSLPSRQALFADWRFWVAVLLALSLFTAALGGSQSPQTIPTA